MELIIDWFPIVLAVVCLTALALAARARRRAGRWSVARLLAASLAAAGLFAAAGLAVLDRADAARRDRDAADGPRFDPAEVYAEQPGWAVGNSAPDVTLRRADTGEAVRLADLAEHRPLVVVFGGFG